MAKERCSESVPDRDTRWPSFHQCKRNGVVKRNGKYYCRAHDPIEQKRRNDERSAKWQEEWDMKEKKRRRDAAMERVCKGVSTDELERLLIGYLAHLLAKEANDG